MTNLSSCSALLSIRQDVVQTPSYRIKAKEGEWEKEQQQGTAGTFCSSPAQARKNCPQNSILSVVIWVSRPCFFKSSTLLPTHIQTIQPQLVNRMEFPFATTVEQKAPCAYFFPRPSTLRLFYGLDFHLLFFFFENWILNATWRALAIFCPLFKRPFDKIPTPRHLDKSERLFLMFMVTLSNTFTFFFLF